MTPWGPADELRSRQLRPGPGHRPGAVEHNQRERLYGAMVTAVAAHGYEATRVADVVRIAGVSRSAFYRHFDNKLTCFLATLDAIAALTSNELAAAYADDGRSWRQRLHAVLEGTIEMVIAQPAAARVWLVEIYAAGPEAIQRMERIADGLKLRIGASLAQTPERNETPVEGIGAVLGGLRQIVTTHLRHGREDELPALIPPLLDWALSYPAPPVPLSMVSQPPPTAPTTPTSDPQRRRIIRAVTDLVAEAGYQELQTVAIAERAAISLSTFYSHFDSKQAAFLAALDDGARQLAEVVQAAYREAPDPPRAVRDAIHALFAFNASHPTMAQLGGRRIFSGGEQGFNHHEEATRALTDLIGESFQRHPAFTPITAEAIAGALAAMLYLQLRHRPPERLYEVAGIASYIALAPFVGAAEACALANEGWQPQP